jgi:hypothetical protein
MLLSTGFSLFDSTQMLSAPAITVSINMEMKFDVAMSELV